MVRVSLRRQREEPIRRAKRDQEIHTRLKKVLSTKVTTAFVGALAELESAFGKIWGHGLPLNKLTENQKLWRGRWVEARDTILNLGNSQVRSLQNELDLHSVAWKGHRRVFPIVAKPASETSRDSSDKDGVHPVAGRTYEPDGDN